MTRFAFTTSSSSTPILFETRKEAVEHLLGLKYANDLYMMSRQEELDAFNGDESEFVNAHSQKAWDNDNDEYNWLVTGVDGISECGWYADEDRTKTALEDAAVRAIWFAKTESVRIDEVEVTMIVNFNTLSDALGPESTEDDAKKFSPLARMYAIQHDMAFDTIRDIQKPGFFFSIDGETVCSDFEWECNQAFNAICSQVVA
jgi:hypothetical protein